MNEKFGVKDAFKTVASLYGINRLFELDEYSSIMSFYVFRKRSLILEAGNRNSIGEKIMIQHFSKDVYGSYLDDKHLQEQKNERFIILSLNDRVLPYSNTQIDVFAEMIIIHELAHLIDQQELLEFCRINLSELDKQIGEKIEAEAEKIAENRCGTKDFVHNRNFGAILNYLLRTKYGTSAPKFMKKALSKTLITIRTKRFYQEV